MSVARTSTSRGTAFCRVGGAGSSREGSRAAVPRARPRSPSLGTARRQPVSLGAHVAAAARRNLGRRPRRCGLGRDEPVPGATRPWPTARRVGVRVLFATNNSVPTRAELRRRLARMRHHGRRRRSPPVGRRGGRHARPGLHGRGPGRGTACSRRWAPAGVTVVPEGPADAVVVGLTRSFTYEDVARAAARRARRGPPRSRPTRTRPTRPADGLEPGGGAMLAAVATAAEAAAEVAGSRTARPPRPIAGRVPPGELRVMVGDRPATDGRARPRSWASPSPWCSPG